MKIQIILILCLFYFIKLNNSQANLFDTYTWTGDVGNYSIVLTGTDFSIEDNFVYVNGIASICSRPTNVDTYQRLVCPPLAINSLLAEGGNLAVYMKTAIGGPISNTQNWKLFKKITVTLKDINTSGGPVTLSGQFLNVDLSNTLVRVKIQGVECQVLSVTSSQIQFISPQKPSSGSYPFSLVVGGFEYTSNINYVYGSPPTFDNKYSWKTVNGKKLLALSGKYFSQDSNNIIIVNGLEYTASTADAAFGSQASIYLLSDVPTNSIAQGASFQVSVKVGGQTSDVKNFNFIKLLVTKTTSLIDIGGVAVFEGEFGNGDITLIKSLTIGLLTPNLQILNTTAIKFQYPKQNVGTYNMILNMGGCELITSITYSATPAPIISKYTWSDNVLSLFGQWFGYYEQNLIYINNVNAGTVQSATLSSGYDVVSVSPSSSPSIGDSFTVRITVNGRSTTANFVYIQSVSMTKKTLITPGGIATFTGSYTVSNPNIVSLKIDGTQCQLSVISPTSIKFIYPPKAIGQYSLLINIGGFEYTTTVQYTNPPTPTLSKTYRWSNTGELIFTGTGISYVNQNQILINGIPYDATPAVNSQVSGFDDITFTSNIATILFREDQFFTAQVSTNGLVSNIVTFNFIKNITMNVTDIYNASGYKGSSYTRFYGTFGTSNTSIVSLIIDNVPCTVFSISPTSIDFSNNYNMNLGDCILILNIGGLVYSTSINVITPPGSKLLKTYNWISNDNMVFMGSTFCYNGPNIVNINGIEYEASYAYSVNGIDHIYFDVTVLISSLTIGQQFTVRVITGIGYSNSVSFLYMKSISINTVGIYNIDGLGSLSTIFYGSYGISDSNAVSLYIGDVECTINSIEPTLINFSHTLNLKIGSNNLHINIGGLEYDTTVYVMSAPAPILLNCYYWSVDGNLVLKGSTFNYKSPNKVNINSVDFNSPSAYSNNGFDQIEFNDNSSTSSLTIGQSFTVYVFNGFENSNSITFVYLKSISINTQSLNNTGGDATFSGEFYVSNTSLVSLLVDNVEVQVTHISPNSISFQYPANSNGEYNLLIKIGGFEYLTTVQYVTKPTPSPSQTTNSQTSDTQTTGTQTTGTQTTGTQTTGTQTIGTQTTGTQTTGTQTTGTQTTGTQTTGTQTTGTQTTGTQTTGTQTTGTQTSGEPDEPSDEEHLSISFKLPISFILTQLSLFLLSLLFL
ncbi:hypothetical protein ACTFIZ_009994 [Dictyostelium cf. discoideum]